MPSERATPPGPESHELAVVLTGGGARGAYQVGLLRHLARRHPQLEIPILTGVSAGAINAVHLASQAGDLPGRVEALARLWRELSVDQVFRVDPASLFFHGARWLAQLSLLGGRRGVPQVRGLVDASPLEELLRRAFGSPDGGLPGIAANLEGGALRAVAVTTTNYATGETITWCQGRSLAAWDRPQRRSVLAPLRVEHVLASSALPLFFPAVQIEGGWYGDGGVRLHSPLSPAAHLGAGRILAVSTRHAPSAQEVRRGESPGYPPPAQILGVLYHAVFLDLLDQDAIHLERVNRLLAGAASERRAGERRIDLLVMRPSLDLGLVAGEFEPRLPRAFRFLTRRLGTRDSRSQDLISMLMFQCDYLQRLIELGEADAQARSDEIAAFLA